MTVYKEPDWEELYKAEFEGAQRKRHEPIADPDTGMVFPNQHDLELFVAEDEELTPLGRHLAETGEGTPVMTPDGLRFSLHDRKKSRGYWEDRARVFAMGQNGQARHGESAGSASAPVEGPEEAQAECPQCAGTGLLDDEELCAVCDGYGVLMVHEA